MKKYCKAFLFLLLCLCLLPQVHVSAADDHMVSEAVQEILQALRQSENPRHVHGMAAEHDLIRSLAIHQTFDGRFSDSPALQAQAITAFEITDPSAYRRDAALIRLCRMQDPDGMFTDWYTTGRVLTALQFFRGDLIAEQAIAAAVHAIQSRLDEIADQDHTLPADTVSALFCGLIAVENNKDSEAVSVLSEMVRQLCPDEFMDPATLQAIQDAQTALKTGACPYVGLSIACGTFEMIFTDTVSDPSEAAAMVTLYNAGIMVGRPTRAAAAGEALTLAELLVMLDRMLPQIREATASVWYADAWKRFDRQLRLTTNAYTADTVVSEQLFCTVLVEILLPIYADYGGVIPQIAQDANTVTRGEAARVLEYFFTLNLKP